jgi:hypothetical protein
VSAVGLDERVVDALGLSQVNRKLAQPVWWHVVAEPGFGGVAGEHCTHTACGIGPLPR